MHNLVGFTRTFSIPRELLIILITLGFLLVGIQKAYSASYEPSEVASVQEHMSPNCALTSMDGKQVDDMRQFRGKVVYVDFWASWCGSCAQSFTFLNELNRDFGASGLHVLGINVDENPKDAQVFLSKHPASFNIAADASGKCPQDFAVKAMPSTYLIDRNGIIRYTHLGFRRSDSKKLREMVEKLLAE